MKPEFLRLLPAVEEVLQKIPLNCGSREIAKEAVQQALEELRQQILAGQEIEIATKEAFTIWILERCQELMQVKSQPKLQKVINATGVILHTNLGRAILADSALEAVQKACSSYCNVEFDLNKGQRGTRYALVEELLRKLTGAEASLVVNNNAAAVLLALNTMAKGKEVIVSRGQLVEIGGSFRIPDIMKQSDCQLIEVGTTNKTHPEDYYNALNENTALLLQVHMSNYRIIGFQQEVSIPEMVEIAHSHNLPVVSDLGSGFLVDMEPFGLPLEPTVQQVVAAGSDIVTFSGDKLLGGPQAGIIVGKQKWIEAMKKNHLTRALRIDKLTLAALEATLREYLEPEQALKNIPTLRMLRINAEELQARAENFQQVLIDKLAPFIEVKLESGFSLVGGGAMPTAQLPTILITVQNPLVPAGTLAEKLRLMRPAVLGLVRENKVLLDLRTVWPEDEELLAESLAQILN